MSIVCGEKGGGEGGGKIRRKNIGGYREIGGFMWRGRGREKFITCFPSLHHDHLA